MLAISHRAVREGKQWSLGNRTRKKCRCLRGVGKSLVFHSGRQAEKQVDQSHTRVT